MRATSSTRAAALAFAVGCACAITGIARPAPLGEAGGTATPVTVHADQPLGRFSSRDYTNISYASAYGPTVSTEGDAAFSWVRATHGVSRIRCYNWLGDGVPKSRPEWFAGCRVAKSGPNGALTYHWEALERVLDTMVASGVTPVIVCGGLPDVLLQGKPKRNETGMAVNGPRSYPQYQELIAQMLRRLLKTYGAEEVRSWHFEVWSQPDHEGSWEGGRTAPFTGEPPKSALVPFLKLYDHFVAAADSVDGRIRIGGPGLAGDEAFMDRFLAHCAKGQNAVTGKPGTRLDFLSFCRWGEPEAVAAYCRDLRKRVATEFPELKSTRLMLAETGLGPGGDTRASETSEAPRMAALVEAGSGTERGADLVFRSGDLIDNHLDGYRPMATQLAGRAVPLPAFRLNMLLAKLGAERLAGDAPAPLGVLATRTSPNAKNAIQALVFRRDSADDTVAPLSAQVRITGLPRSLILLPLRIYTITPERQGVREAWIAAGKPVPAPAELAARFSGRTPYDPVLDEPSTRITAGEAIIPLTLPPNSVALIALGSEPSFDVSLGDRGERLLRAEQEYGLAADLVRHRQYETAATELRKVQSRYPDTYWTEVVLQTLVGVYELDLRSPVQAEAVRRELLASGVDGSARLTLLNRLRIDALRRGEKAEVARLAKESSALEASMALLRNWPLRRYGGE